MSKAERTGRRITVMSHPPPGYRTQSPDTSYEAEQVQFEILRRMGPEGRAALMQSLNRAVLRLARAGIRARHPDASEREIFLRMAALRLDRDMMIRVYGWDPEEHR
jgi:hypothetical protein